MSNNNNEEEEEGEKGKYVGAVTENIFGPQSLTYLSSGPL